MRKRVTLLIPLTFNDGSEVPSEVMQSIRGELLIAFGGWTIVGTVEGAYRMQATGQEQMDRLLHVWVVIEDDRIDELKSMVARWGKLFGQEAMYFETAESTIDFIPPANGEELSDEEAV